MIRPMISAVAIGLFFSYGAVGAAAQNVEPIKQRKALMKEMGKLTKGPGEMLKGAAPFDLAAVQAALKTYQENAPKLKTLFPDDSKTGEETAALPSIWENKDDVLARFDKLVADAKDAEGKITDEFTFMDEFPKVAGNCGGCHRKYQKEK